MSDTDRIRIYPAKQIMQPIYDSMQEAFENYPGPRDDVDALKISLLKNRVMVFGMDMVPLHFLNTNCSGQFMYFDVSYNILMCFELEADLLLFKTKFAGAPSLTEEAEDWE